MNGSNLNRIGNNTHKLIAEDLRGNVLLLATGTIEYCIMVYRQKAEDIEAGRLKMNPGDKIYVAEVNKEITVFGPDFEYEVLGKKL
ncbi:hypothetical protein GMA3_70 [Gordonia phage GMA3]|uniref:Uncharacterized protein n=1 Tax=Gordonia phage GMA3 TaxID=1647284 RepID=A0A0K0NL20_9CAUD|nr:hypothetical protein AU105_gp070 [Gordonia phage GMA3]AKL88247.1 hypothetical protein GMA3_70 [Gordonia phage GMA3]